MSTTSLPISDAPAAPVERPWSRLTWFLIVLLTCSAQFGFIFLLGARHPIVPIKPWPAPPLTLLGDNAAALVELTDPTVFVLPSRHGFSGAARALAPRTQFVAPDWNEPYRWLGLSEDKLGETFNLLLTTDPATRVQIAQKTEAHTAPLLTAPAMTLAPQSNLRIEGDLAARDLAAPLDLSSWPSADVLKPSVVQVIVSPAGRVISSVLLGSSELTEADQRALELARAARFEPATGTANLTWGRMIFAWHTIPLPAADPTVTPTTLP